ncbi:MAG: T9SS type A sorting domain-containing protein [Chitinophagales bacterium]|nr:T9SS type A sorting domain-containing protein [Bacteroidota bacterium]MCB9042806.1 T9SS type A sorting domain-containing protein [Chitinophagales bacterium]
MISGKLPKLIVLGITFLLSFCYGAMAQEEPSFEVQAAFSADCDNNGYFIYIYPPCDEGFELTDNISGEVFTTYYNYYNYSYKFFASTDDTLTLDYTILNYCTNETEIFSDTIIKQENCLIFEENDFGGYGYYDYYDFCGASIYNGQYNASFYFEAENPCDLGIEVWHIYDNQKDTIYFANNENTLEYSEVACYEGYDQISNTIYDIKTLILFTNLCTGEISFSNEFFYYPCEPCSTGELSILINSPRTDTISVNTNLIWQNIYEKTLQDFGGMYAYGLPFFTFCEQCYVGQKYFNEFSNYSAKNISSCINSFHDYIFVENDFLIVDVDSLLFYYNQYSIVFRDEENNRIDVRIYFNINPTLPLDTPLEYTFSNDFGLMSSYQSSGIQYCLNQLHYFNAEVTPQCTQNENLLLQTIGYCEDGFVATDLNNGNSYNLTADLQDSLKWSIAFNYPLGESYDFQITNLCSGSSDTISCVFDCDIAPETLHFTYPCQIPQGLSKKYNPKSIIDWLNTQVNNQAVFTDPYCGDTKAGFWINHFLSLDVSPENVFDQNKIVATHDQALLFTAHINGFDIPVEVHFDDPNAPNCSPIQIGVINPDIIDIFGGIIDTANDSLWIFGSGKTETDLLNKTHNLRIFPNPASSDFQVELPPYLEGATLSFFNAQGSLVQQIVGITNRENIDIRQLPKGVYFLHFQQLGYLKVEKLVVM